VLTANNLPYLRFGSSLELFRDSKFQIDAVENWKAQRLMLL